MSFYTINKIEDEKKIYIEFSKQNHFSNSAKHSIISSLERTKLFPGFSCNTKEWNFKIYGNELCNLKEFLSLKKHEPWSYFWVHGNYIYEGARPTF